ncbi:hypothetical protein [Reyranella sp.]|uniref:hypothetical protein n=1 Tax=Reyranella sp. TaxID=1929291 RepID=UPI003D112315
MFDPNSRYLGVAGYTAIDRRGRMVTVIPAPDKPEQALLGLHRRTDGQRLDHLAFHYLADPAGYWRICELSDVMLPDALAEARDIPIPVKAD